MDSSKKRRLEEAEEEVEDEVEEDESEEEEEEEEEDEEDEGQQNGGGVSEDEVRALIEPFSKEQIMDLLAEKAMADPQLLSKIRKLADKDPAHRKLFIRGLGWDITRETLKGVFSQYGNIDDCSIVKDKHTGKSKGYGFVTFKHMDGARRALKEPSKKIDGRITVCQLASVGPSLPSNDQTGRKIYVGNVPHDLTADKILSVFSQYGDIEEGPLGFDKLTGKSKGYALIIYKSAESAKKALKEPAKTIDGHQVNCKIATSDGGQRVKMDVSDLALNQSGGIVGAAPNLPYSALSGLLPLNQGILGQHSLAPAVLAAQGLLSGLTPSTGLASFNPSLAHQLALGSSLNSSLNASLNPQLSSSLNASLPQGGSQSLSQASLASYGLHGLGMYGSQVASLGASSLYGGSTSTVGSQSGILQGTGQGYTSSQPGQGSGGRSQSLPGFLGN